jgi:hypothetical protein
MVGVRVELGGGVAEEVGEGDGRKRVRICVVGRVLKNHCYYSICSQGASLQCSIDARVFFSNIQLLIPVVLRASDPTDKNVIEARDHGRRTTALKPFDPSRNLKESM